LTQLVEDAVNLLAPLERDILVEGRRLHLLDWGGEGRQPLLLLHGFAAHAHAWDTLAIALQPHYHVFALDQRGHGDSDPAEQYGPVVTADDIDALVDATGIESMILIGLSMGGRNAMYYAATRPERVSKLVIIDIGPEISRRVGQPAAGEPEPETWESIEQAAQHLNRGNPYPGIHYFRWVVSHSLKQREDGALIWKWSPTIRQPAGSQPEIDWWDILRSIKAPTLVLRGAESPVLDADVAERMATELADGRYIEIANAVHTLHEDNPVAVQAAIEEFLASQGKAPA
jgi:pimeloyl-ACP methyl ester carboxylesterase